MIGRDAEEKRLVALAEKTVRGASDEERALAASLLLSAAVQHYRNSNAHWGALQEERGKVPPRPLLTLTLIEGGEEQP